MNEYNEAMANEYSYEYWLSRHDLHNGCSMSDCAECVNESTKGLCTDCGKFAELDKSGICLNCWFAAWSFDWSFDGEG